MKSLIYILLSFLVIGFASCTEEIDIALEDGEIRLVVDAQVTDKANNSYVRLLKSKASIYEVGVEYINKASVSVFVNDEPILLNLSSTEPGLFEFPEGFIGEYGKNYRLEISDVDLNKDGKNEIYKANGRMPKALSMDSVGYQYQEFPGGTTGFFITCFAQEPSDRNYYIFRAYKNYHLVTDTLTECELQEDSPFNGSYIYNMPMIYLYDGKPDEYVNDGDTLTLQIDNVNEDYYLYFADVQRSQFGSVPIFGGPPANVRTNISNGGLGIFRVFSSDTASVVVTKAVRP